MGSRLLWEGPAPGWGPGGHAAPQSPLHLFRWHWVVSRLWHSRGLVVRFGPESPPVLGCKPLPAGRTRGTPRLDLSHRTLSGRFWSQPRGPTEGPAQAAPGSAATCWGWSCASRRPARSVTRQGAGPTESEALAPGPGTEPAHPGCPIQTGFSPPAGQRVPPVPCRKHGPGSRRASLKRHAFKPNPALDAPRRRLPPSVVSQPHGDRPWWGCIPLPAITGATPGPPSLYREVTPLPFVQMLGRASWVTGWK